MPIKSFRPFTPSRRYMTVVTREGITTDKPEKSLVEKKVGRAAGTRQAA